MSDLPFCTPDIKQEVKIRMGKDGQSALPATTIMRNWDAIVKEHGDKPALHQKVMKMGDKVAETPWTTWTWKEYRAQVDAFGKVLIALDCDKFDSVNILGFNAPEWFFASYGAIAAGCVPAGIYATNNPEACKYVTDHSKAKVVVCEGVKQLEKYYDTSKDLPNLKALVMYGEDSLPADVKSLCSVPVYTFKDFLNLGKDVSDEALKERSDSWKPGETCTLIYTSGTTGNPKGVMLTNDNITWNVKTVMKETPKGNLDHNDIMISYLPLSHIAAQMLDMHTPLETGCQIYFAQPDALKGSLGATLKDVRPTIFFGVPRVWEKIYEKLQQVGKSTKGVKKMLSTWAKKRAAAHWASKEFGSTSRSPCTYGIAKKLLHKAHVALGLDRCYGFYVGAAPMELKVMHYFASIDVPIFDLFGQSECTAPHSVNTYGAFRFGTIGRQMHGCQTKIVKSNGEMCLFGRHICAGYLGMPDQTSSAIDEEGWLHTGDVAEIDSDGFIKITGRIKELIITAGGENVPPVLIEDAIKECLPAVSNAMVIGDKRKFLSVLLCLHVEVDEDGVPLNKLTGTALEVSKEIESAAVTTEEAKEDSKWKEYIDKGISEANERATSRAQKIGKWTILTTDFSEKGGELTPTLKLKRAVAANKYAKVIEGMYQ